MGAGALDLWGAEPTVLGRYTRFIALTQGWPIDAFIVTAGMRKLSPLFGMLRLRHVLHVEHEQVRLEPTGLKELPRALLVPSWKIIPDAEELLGSLGSPTFDPERLALLENDPGLGPPEIGADDPGRVSITDVSTEVIEVHAETRHPAILVITDNYSASWRAEPWDDASDRTYRVLPVDYTLRAIPLPAGNHHLRLEYRPTALAFGAWVSALALALYVVVMVALIVKPAASSRERPGG